MNEATDKSGEPIFSVLCQCKDSERHLYLRDLSFARLIDDVVVPFETDEPFFVDGVSLGSGGVA